MNKGSMFVDKSIAAEVYSFVISDDKESKAKEMGLEMTGDSEKIAETVRNLVTKHTEGVAERNKLNRADIRYHGLHVNAT